LVFTPTAIAVAAVVGLTICVGLVEASAAEASLQMAVKRLGSSGLVVVSDDLSGSPEGFAAFQNLVDRQARGDLGPLAVKSGEFAEASDLVLASRNSVDVQFDAGTVTGLTSFDDLAAHVQVVRGGWPSGPGPNGLPWISVPETTAAALQVEPGEAACFTTLQARGKWCARVTAVWRPRAPAEAFWGSQPAPMGVLCLDLAPFYAAAKTFQLAVTAESVLSPKVSEFHAGNEADVVARVRRFKADLSLLRPLPGLSTASSSQGSAALAHTAVQTGLDSGIEDYLRQSSTAAFAVELAAFGIVLIALYGAGFVGGRLLAGQRRSIAVWRSRGWRRRGILSLLILEIVTTVLVACPIGLVLGISGADALLAWTYRQTQLLPSRDGIWALIATLACLSAIAAAAVLVVQAFGASRVAVAHVRRAGQVRLPWWQWRYMDLLLAAAGVPLLLGAQQIAQPEVRASATASANWAALMLAGMAVLLLALPASRLLVVVARLMSYGGRGVASALAAVQLGRRAGQHAGLAVLLTLAVSVGVFAAADAGTQLRAAEDRSAYAVGADFRVTFTGHGPIDPGQLDALSGLGRYSLAYRGWNRLPELGDIPLLGVDPFTIQGVAWSRQGLNTQPMSGLLRLLAEHDTTGLVLPPDTHALGVWVRSAGGAVRVEADLVDGDGRPLGPDRGPVQLGTAQPGEWRLVEGAVSSGRPLLRLHELRVVSEASSGAPVTVALSDLSTATATGSWKVIDGSDTVDDPHYLVAEPLGPPTLWWSRDPRSGTSQGAIHASSAIQHDGRPTFVSTLSPGATWALHAPLSTAGPVPALLSSGLLRRTGVRVGENLPLDVNGANVPAVIVGAVDYFPSLYDQLGGFIVVHRDALLARLAGAGEDGAWPGEVWMGVAPANRVRVRQVVSHLTGVTDLQDLDSVRTAALSDPQALSLQANLAVGAVGALMLSLVGFLFHFALIGQGRAAEYAILEANGMQVGLIRRSLRIEQILVLLCGLLAGLAVGAALSYTLLGALDLGTDVQQRIPPSVITIKTEWLVGLLLGTVAAGLLASVVLSRIGSRARLADVLRYL
jgi:hypothetical protein